ncbi:MAG: GntR family transcriptional regulator [Erysipelotrichaceae bacterium]|nr:GntR family transcriptional regulator [Erysipelotrichaceae bacterium]
MKMIISNSSPVPIYEQIKNSIIEQILGDELKEGEAIPSIRSLAQDIKISVMTIKKAYDELEQEGYIVSVQGKGTFVATKNNELVREKAQKEIESYVAKITDIAMRFDISKEELIEVIDLFYGGNE